MKYKIYYDKDLLKNNSCVPFLLPIEKLSYNYREPYDKGQIESWKSVWKKLIQYSNIEECDFVVFPINYKVDYFVLLKKCAYESNKYGKKVIVFYDTDIELPIPYINNIIVFRTSLNDSSPIYENPYPTFIPSIWKKNKIGNNGEISIWYSWYSWKLTIWSIIMEKIRWLRIYKSLITFLFNKLCIYTIIPDNICKDPLWKWDILTFLLLQKWKQIFYRAKVLERLKSSKYKFNFIKREKVLNPSCKWELREQYIDNIQNSTFTLVVRWYWNHAYRLYETMSAGKIPLFIDTESRIPFDNQIDFKSLFIRVPFSDIKNIDSYIDKYVSKHQNEFDNICDRIYEIYLSYFRMETYFPKLLNIIHWKLK